MSSQFHAVVDDEFSTVPSLRDGSMSDNWHQLVCNSREKSTDGFYDVTRTCLTADHDIPEGDTVKATERVDTSTDPGSAITPQAMESTNTRADQKAGPQAEEPTETCVGQLKPV